MNANTLRARPLRVQHPDLDNPLYFNTGHKQDVSGFAKLGYTAGAQRCSATCRRGTPSSATRPDVHADIAEQLDLVVVPESESGCHVSAHAPAVGIRVVRQEHARAGAQRHVRRLRQSRHVERRVRRRPESRETGDGARPRDRHELPRRDARRAGQSLLDGLPQRDRADRRAQLHRQPAAQERRVELPPRHRGRRHVSRNPALDAHRQTRPRA